MLTSNEREKMMRFLRQVGADAETVRDFEEFFSESSTRQSHKLNTRPSGQRGRETFDFDDAKFFEEIFSEGSTRQSREFNAPAFGAASTFFNNDSFVNAAQKMAAYDTLCENLSQLNTMRGGSKGFKGFVGEQMQAANASAVGRATRVVNNNGPIDLIFDGKNGRHYPQQVKIGYKPGQIDFSKYKGQDVIVDKGNPHFRQLRAEGARHGVKVIEGTVTEAEAKWWADAMQLETKITGGKTSVIVPKAQWALNNISAMHEAGKHFGKSGAMYGAGFSIGSNIVNMMRGNVSAGEAIGNVACDTAVSYGAGYATGAVGSAIARTAAGKAIGSAVGSATAAISGTAVGGAVTGAVGSATAAVGGLATSAVGGAVGAIGSAGAAVGGALTAATAGTAIGGAVATGVGAVGAAGAALGAAAVAAAPVVAVGAVVGAIGSFLFGDD